MNILIVEDHPVVGDTLCLTLRSAFREATVVLTDTASAALIQLPKSRWSIILLDIDLPDRSGLDLLRDLHSLAPKSPVLIFSGRSEQEFGRRVLAAGAMGFLSKMAPSSEILIAIRRVLAGKKYISMDLASSLLQDPLHPDVLSPHHLLSSRELEVLRLLGAGCAPKDIAQRLSISAKTVSTYRTRILEKLSLDSTASLIRYAVTHKLAD